MCGICGRVGDKAIATVQSMLPRLAHRGPDSSDNWFENSVALGHTRLSIVDLSQAGNQPIHHNSGQLVGIVNGEIYNYLELRKELECEGARFLSNSDSEVVIHAYWHWGVRSFRRLNGMFAFALYDKRKHSLIIVRDRLGIKPLYYYSVDESFTFASEIKAILASVEKRRWSINVKGLSELLTYQNMFDEATLFDGISLLTPASYLVVDEKFNITKKKYWCIEEVNRQHSTGFESNVDRFKEIFEKSVERHLLADVPVSTYLSAGFDSSIVATQASLIKRSPLTSYTGHFSTGGWYDESSVARSVAKNNGSEHVLVSIDANDFRNKFDDLIFALDEPRMGMGAFPQYMVAQEAAKRHKVILSGHGGDELFAGYPIFKLAFGLANLKSSLSGAAGFLSSIKASELPHFAYFALGRLLGGEESFGLPVLNSTLDKQNLLQPNLWKQIKDNDPTMPLRSIGEDNNSWVDQIFSVYLKTYLNGLLIVEDKISMAHSLETRTPLLDNEMLEFSLNLGNSAKLYKYELKAIIKCAGKSALPSDLYNQPKRGFPTPLRYWVRGPLKDWARQRLLGSDSRLTNIFQRKGIANFFDKYQGSLKGSIRALDEVQSQRVWQYLCLESWLRQCETELGVEIVVGK